uniref:Uncharacterized protein n=1 Tax=Candidatus Kentrum sp. SD TaxID=2126332 RepID=A0A451BM31_9GAMM|nr:MAG: hypothetical protein BECKSD772D_GA0070982_10463 [Candidatus Kentron sp. SD]
MSERGNNNTPEARNGNGDIPERQGKGGRVLAWCKRNADYLMLFAAIDNRLCAVSGIAGKAPRGK